MYNDNCSWNAASHPTYANSSGQFFIKYKKPSHMREIFGTTIDMQRKMYDVVGVVAQNANDHYDEIPCRLRCRMTHLKINRCWSVHVYRTTKDISWCAGGNSVSRSALTWRKYTGWICSMPDIDLQRIGWRTNILNDEMSCRVRLWREETSFAHRWISLVCWRMWGQATRIW